MVHTAHWRYFALALMAVTCSALAQTAPYVVESQLDQIHIVALEALPQAPASSTNECVDIWREPDTAAGKVIAAHGWTVTSEVPLDGFTLVGFYSDARLGTSSMCFIKDGNVAVYRDTTLLAIVYGPEQPRAEADQHVSPTAVVASTPIPHTARLWSSPGGGRPAADLFIAKQRIQVQAVADREPVCDGGAAIPDLHGMPITEARQRLLATGWTPVPGPADSRQYEPVKSLYQQGVTEVQDCSGTGLGYCSFHYQRDDEHTDLSVSSVGEEFRVDDYNAECNDPD